MTPFETQSDLDHAARVYAATGGGGGVLISTDGGNSYTEHTGAGLGDDTVNGVWASGSTIYAATNGGLSISTDGGSSWINYAGAVPNFITTGVWGDSSNVYVTGRIGGGVSFGL